MKKVGIITINDYDNYGNRLQNYATQEIIKKYGFDTITLKNSNYSNDKKFFLIKHIKHLTKKKKNTYSTNQKRKNNFEEFNKFISFSKNKITAYTKKTDCDYYIVGSDQVWNPKIGRMKDVDLLTFAQPEKRISLSASIAIDEIPKEKEAKATKEFLKFKNISIREEKGKEIIEKLTNRKDVEVLIDPTMALDQKEWDKVIKKPTMLNKKKFILNYFLGELSDKRKKIIEDFANKNECEIINILDKNSIYYECGPSEFLYLEKNAFFIFTDSFHSSVFALIFNKPFLVFNREQQGVESMNSRIDTLLKKFKLEDRKFDGEIKENIENNYIEAYNILKKERERLKNYIEKALDI